MWNTSHLNGGIEVNWLICDGAFEVKCAIKSDFNAEGCRLNIFAGESGKESRICLGSFAAKDGAYVIHKQYTVAYLALQNISVDKWFGFDISDFVGNVIFSSDKHDENQAEQVMGDEDFAVTRAKNLLNSVKGTKSGFDIAEAVAANTSALMTKYERVNINCFDSFKWIKITTLSESFDLSSVAHVIFEPEFVHLFGTNGEWFFGQLGMRMFAVGIRSNFQNTPFPNAADCSTCKEDIEGIFFHAVGIALLDDGQYFYRI